MKRGDDPRHAPAVGRGEHDLLGQIRGGGMRHRVVRMNHVEAELARDLDDARGQGDHVLRLTKERIRRCINPVKAEPRLVLTETKGGIGADQMHFVAAPRQGLGQLGGDDAAAADRGVTHDADIHPTLRSSKSETRSCGSRTMTPSAKATPVSAPRWASRLSISCRKLDAVSRVDTRSGSLGANWLT